jgi:site-specific DNA-cytosine methylase
MVHQESADEPLTVGDLFCGAGGFAEGFRQAGFKVVWGVDSWDDATNTLKHNFPESAICTADLLKLDPGDLDPVDVVIGSPPCVHFSPANRGGNGDRNEGMKLVRRFLEFVIALKPRYWVMENVPALLPDLQERMRGDTFTENGLRIAIPTRVVLDASRFGTPQSRRRLFSGVFPFPEVLANGQSSAPTLRTVVEALPSPCEEAPHGNVRVRDPGYPGHALPVVAVRDHFEDSRWALSRAEVEGTAAHRARDRIYGVMPFPDDLDSPARTVTATKTPGSRATFVIPCPTRRSVPYRTLTLRECASVQGFPLGYQFWAGSVSAKDFLVGNAVPPPLARAVACGILRAEHRDPPQNPLIHASGELPPLVILRSNGPRRFSMRRRFRESVSIDWRRDHRVELDNELPIVRAVLPSDVLPPITWRSRIYLGYATLYRCYEPRFTHALGLARGLSDHFADPAARDSLKQLLLAIVQGALNGFPDGIVLQEEWSGWRPTKYGPWRVLSLVDHHVGRAFPVAEWAGQTVPVSITGPILESCITAHRGDEATVTQPFAASIRLVMASIALSLLCERLNEGTSRLETLFGALVSTSGIESRRVDGLLRPGGRGSLKGESNGLRVTIG